MSITKQPTSYYDWKKGVGSPSDEITSLGMTKKDFHEQVKEWRKKMADIIFIEKEAKIEIEPGYYIKQGAMIAALNRIMKNCQCSSDFFEELDKLVHNIKEGKLK